MSNAAGVRPSERLEQLRHEMKATGTDAVLLSLGSDLPYFTGYAAMPLERITMLVVHPTARPVLFVPELEAPRVEPGGAFKTRPWNEWEDPLDLIAAEVGESRQVAVADQTWAGFLLGLQRRLPGAQWRSADLLTRRPRMRKDPEELAALRAAGQAADRVAERLRSERFAGRTERDLSGRIGEMLMEEGHESVNFAIVASGPNGASPHHEASERIIAPGDGIVLDFGGSMHGYASDTSRTFHVGEPGSEFADAFSVLRRAQEAAVEAVRPGRAAQDIDRRAREIITEAGYGEFFIHRTGHGIGLDTHEHPYIIEGNELLLEPGMCFSVEPGIYVPGSFGMRIEDIVTVTDAGVERLNQSDRDLVIV